MQPTYFFKGMQEVTSNANPNEAERRAVEASATALL